MITNRPETRVNYERAVYASIDLPSNATNGAQFDTDNQRAWPDMLVKIEEINDKQMPGAAR